MIDADVNADRIPNAHRCRPWDLHAALTEERLSACARLLARGRADAVAMADSWAGDDAWSIGCRAYSFSRNRLRQAAEGGRYPWLGVLDQTHHFVFMIEGVPVRFFRGDADEPSKRTLRQQESEAEQLALALGDAGAADRLMFRLAVETDEGGGVTRVVFLALRGEGGAVECFWPVPTTDDQASTGGRRNAGPAMQLPLAGGRPPGTAARKRARRGTAERKPPA